MQQKNSLFKGKIKRVEFGERHRARDKQHPKNSVFAHFLKLQTTEVSHLWTREIPRRNNWTMNFPFLKDPTCYVWYKHFSFFIKNSSFGSSLHLIGSGEVRLSYWISKLRFRHLNFIFLVWLDLFWKVPTDVPKISVWFFFFKVWWKECNNLRYLVFLTIFLYPTLQVPNWATVWKTKTFTFLSLDSI